MEQETLGTLEPLGAGWTRYHSVDLPGDVLVLFATQGGRRVPVGLYMTTEEGGALEASSLRRLPLGRVEAMANAIPADEWVTDRHGRVVQKLERALAELAGALRDDDTEVLQRFNAPLVKLVPPRGRNYGDDFYNAVAFVYGVAAATSTRPAEVIAKSSKVPVTTVHRWVKESRRRGFLPPGRPGKAG